MVASSTDNQKSKLHILLVPFFATSHIRPFTDLAFQLTAARPDAVEATVAVTPANVPVVQGLLAQRGSDVEVKLATYPFPAGVGLRPGVESLSAGTAAEAPLIEAVLFDEKLMRPLHESLIRKHSPDVVVADIPSFWNPGVAADLGVPCVTFHVIGTFSMLAMTQLAVAGVLESVGEVVTVPRFPGKEIRVPVIELPETLRYPERGDCATGDRVLAAQRICHGVVVNTFFGLEPEYCEAYPRNGYAERTYFVGPLSLPSPSSPSVPAAGDNHPWYDDIVGWLDSKPSRSVVYVAFGSLSHVSGAQLHELALGLEASGVSFLWVARAAEKWSPPAGWEKRIGERGMLVTSWVPQQAILGHPAVGVFVTHCGWNSVLETIAAGVPVLTWPILFEQFITERLVTEVLGIGERLWPEGVGVRSTMFEEKEVVPAAAVAEAVAQFMEPGGAAETARRKVQGLAAKAHAAVSEGGSSHRDLRRLLDDLMEARAIATSSTPRF